MAAMEKILSGPVLADSRRTHIQSRIVNPTALPGQCDSFHFYCATGKIVDTLQQVDIPKSRHSMATLTGAQTASFAPLFMHSV
jgi:hypothetical protein